MKELAKVLMGSQNYSLDGFDSDKDYKVLLCPTFEDLYNVHRVEKNDLPAKYPKDEHYSVMDCRQFAKSLVRGNVNCCEYLFSTEVKMSSTFVDFYAAARKLYEDGYAVVCWEQLFASLEGLVKNSFDRYGATRKTMSRAYYFYLFAVNLAVNNFCMSSETWRGNKWNDLVYKMRFDENSWMPSQEQFKEMLDWFKEESKKSMQSMYKNYPEHVEKLKERGNNLNQLMKDLVKHEVLMEDA